MKKLYISVFLCFLSFYSFAQEEFDLFGNWILHYRTIDGSIEFPPLTSSENYSIELQFSLLPPDASFPFIIESFGPMASFFQGRFDLTDGVMEIFNVEEIELNCKHPPVVCSYYENYNNDILFDPNTLVETGAHILTVELDESGGNPILIIINEFNGDRAVYGNQPLSIDDHQSIYSKITLVQNPIDDTLSLLGNNMFDKDYEIYDSSGQLILNGFVNSNRIDVNALPSGLYLLLLTNANSNSQTLKFIKK